MERVCNLFRGTILFVFSRQRINGSTELLRVYLRSLLRKYVIVSRM